MPTFEPNQEEQWINADEAALDAEEHARQFAPHDTVGFARRYQCATNPFADGYAEMQAGAFNPVNLYDTGNPLNPMNQYNRNNPFNPMNEADWRNPASPMNRGTYNVPFAPLR